MEIKFLVSDYYWRQGLLLIHRIIRNEIKICLKDSKAILGESVFTKNQELAEVYDNKSWI